MLAVLGIFFSRQSFMGLGTIIQNSVLAHPDFKYNAIGILKQEILITFLLVDGVYITHSLN